VLYVLARLGIVTPRWLASRRRWAILIIAVVSAVATPGGDPFSMVILALFMYALFEITLVVVRGIHRDRPPEPVPAQAPAELTDGSAEAPTEPPVEPPTDVKD
jgi:Sec-independent protein secretion pathway component TatC